MTYFAVPMFSPIEDPWCIYLYSPMRVKYITLKDMGETDAKLQ